MSYVDIETTFTLFTDVENFLRTEAKIVAGISKSQYPEKDIETELKQFSKVFRDQMDVLEVELKKKEYHAPLSYFFAFRDQGVEASEYIKEVKEACKILGTPRILIKIEYKSRHLFKMTIRNIGVGHGEKIIW